MIARRGLALAILIATLPLGACANTKGAVDFVNAVETNLNHCHHTVNYQLSVGALNPGSGAQVQGTVDCPAIPPAPAPTPAP